MQQFGLIPGSVSDGMDGTPQDAYKALKMEYGSDVHHETRDRHHLELQPATSHHGMSNTSVIEASPREKQKGGHTEKYVQSGQSSDLNNETKLQKALYKE